jgi:ribosomal protein S18 acetylase RimI-like enzyme
VAETDLLEAPHRRSIRRLERQDAALYRQIRLAALSNEPSAYGSTLQVERVRPISAFEERLESSVVLAMLIGQTPIGMVGLKQEEGARERHKAFLWGMYVEAAYRRQGVGSAMLEALLEQARLMVEQVTLTVVMDNLAAIDLYRRLGFSSYGVEPNALKTANGYSDELLMVKFLEPFNDHRA